MMLTAENAADGTVIDLTRFVIRDPVIRKMNGQHNARRNGYALLCRGCQRPAHLVLNHHETMFFRHNPGTGRACILEEAARLGAGQSEAHITGKALLAGAIRDLTGWSADLEQRYDRAGDTVIVDVAASYEGEAVHTEQGLYAWEVQLAPQAEGAFYDRTTVIERTSGRRVRWLTPHAATAGTTVSMICSPEATHIVDRVLESIEPPVPSPAFELGRLVRAIHRTHPGYLWFQGGEFGEWLIANRNAFGGLADDPTLARRRHRGHYNTVRDQLDELCTRPRIEVECWSPPIVEYHDYGPNRCAICGEPIDRRWGFGADPPQCEECFRRVQSRELRVRPR